MFSDSSHLSHRTGISNQIASTSFQLLPTMRSTADHAQQLIDGLTVDDDMTCGYSDDDADCPHSSGNKNRGSFRALHRLTSSGYLPTATSPTLSRASSDLTTGDEPARLPQGLSWNSDKDFEDLLRSDAPSDGAADGECMLASPASGSLGSLGAVDGVVLERKVRGASIIKDLLGQTSADPSGLRIKTGSHSIKDQVMRAECGQQASSYDVGALARSCMDGVDDTMMLSFRSSLSFCASSE